MFLRSWPGDVIPAAPGCGFAIVLGTRGNARMKRQGGEPWMPAWAYWRSLTALTVNLRIRDTAATLVFGASSLTLARRAKLRFEPDGDPVALERSDDHDHI